VKALHTGLMPANRNMDEPLEETEGWPMVPNWAIKVPNIDKVMVNAFGFGGKNRVAIIGKTEG
jgi:3-oxoacyl-(acyl-carrier-protein) synthase